MTDPTPKPDIEDQFKAAIATTEGKAKADIAEAFGYIRVHWLWAIPGAFIIGVLVGFFIFHK